MVHVATRKELLQTLSPSPPLQVPPDAGSHCRCWWHPESQAPSSWPRQSHFVFRATNSLAPPPFKIAPQSTSDPEISGQLPKSSTPGYQFPHPWGWQNSLLQIVASLPTHSGSYNPFSHSSLELPISKKLSGPPRLLWQPPAPPAGKASPAGCQNALTLSLPPANTCFPLWFFLRIHEQMVLKTQHLLSHSPREQMQSPSTNWDELDFLKS